MSLLFLACGIPGIPGARVYRGLGYALDPGIPGTRVYSGPVIPRTRVYLGPVYSRDSGMPGPGSTWDPSMSGIPVCPGAPAHPRPLMYFALLHSREFFVFAGRPVPKKHRGVWTGSGPDPGADVFSLACSAAGPWRRSLFSPAYGTPTW
jgi:hypothetical protein